MTLRNLLREIGAVRVFGLAMITVWSSWAYAMDYFTSGIDYWGSSPATSSSQDDLAPPAPPTSFPWAAYLDPASDEFFREGDYLPPRPLMEVARHPTDANIRNWLALAERKNQLMERLQRRMAEYSAGRSIPSPVPAAAPAETPNASIGPIDPRRFRLRLYFDSHCPHCHNMLATLAELRDRGFSVEVRQVDGDTGATASLPFPASRIEPGELAARGVASVPVLLIADLKHRQVYRINGYQPFESVLRILRERPG